MQNENYKIESENIVSKYTFITRKSFNSAEETPYEKI